ncbi:hypothetical protein WME75_04050 [Sorangium sp. So ce1014]|uniref:HipA-like protein n=1 Tax=Sorangium sp. So ce1014 TaxID=3133326 RepID=UPI003F6179F4
MATRDEFPIRVIHVPGTERRDEQLGSKRKFWFRDGPGRWSLFKLGRENEDWSEKVGTELARLLGLPCASVELAECDGRAGIVSPSFLSNGDRLVHGNELLLHIDPGYPGAGQYHVRQHTVDAVMGALDEFRAMPWETIEPFIPETFGAQGVFVGYLLLDAWIGNSDRHHENWAVVQRGSQRFLAPSYDHASSLGRNEQVEKIERRLVGRDSRFTVDLYASKCRSAFYLSQGMTRPMTTRDAFEHARSLYPEAARYWLSRLVDIDDSVVAGVWDRVPGERCSVPHRRFAERILKSNRDHLTALNREVHD